MQPISTDHGDYNFVQVYKGQTARDPVTRQQIGVNGGIGELDSGAWVWYPQCLPITNPNEAVRLLDSINPEGTARFKRWWVAEQHRQADEAMAPVVRPIKIVGCEEPPGSKLVYDDGSGEDVTDAGSVLAYFARPGPVQDFAMHVFGTRHKAAKDEAIRDETETDRAKLARQINAQREAKKPGAKKQPGRPATRTLAKQAGTARPSQVFAGMATTESEG